MKQLQKQMLVGWVYNDRRTRKHPVFITVEYESNRFDLNGVVGPRANGDAWGGCGQIRDFQIDVYADGWNAAKVAYLKHIWGEYHLNYLKPGTPNQAYAVNVWLQENKYDYDAICEYLRTIDLYIDYNPLTGEKHTYGWGYFNKTVPMEVVYWFDQFADASPIVPSIWRDGYIRKI